MAFQAPHSTIAATFPVVCALQSGAAAAAGGDQEASDIARLARALVAAYERGGRVFALNAIAGGSNNWRLRAKMADDSFFSNAADWSFGGPGGCCAAASATTATTAGLCIMLHLVRPWFIGLAASFIGSGTLSCCWRCWIQVAVHVVIACLLQCMWQLTVQRL